MRLTGGEPNVRAHIVELVREIAAVPGIRSLSMTTNGVLLGKLAQPLKEAGLQRVNISLDTLDSTRFKKITRWGSFDQVWYGINAAEAAGLTPVKLNAVLMRGINDDEPVPLLRFALAHGYELRFIEQMPLDAQHAWRREEMVSAEEILAQLRAAFTLEPDPRDLLTAHSAEPMRSWPISPRVNSQANDDAAILEPA